MHFPITIIDNFFDEPDRIVTFANSLQYHPRQKGDYWYGLRSKPLHEVDKGYFEWSSQKILRAFYKDQTLHVCNTCFQKTPGIKNISNEGWIHTDKCLMAAIIYLDKDNISGTNFYKSKTFGKEKFISSEIHNKDSFTEEEFEKARDKNNKHFEKTVEVMGLYNRAVIYDAKVYHGANFHPLNTERLTQVFFFYKIEKNWFPVVSIRKFEE